MTSISPSASSSSSHRIEQEEVKFALTKKVKVQNGDFASVVGPAFRELITFVSQKSLWPSVGQCLGISPEDPRTHPICNYFAAISIQPHALEEVKKIADGSSFEVQEFGGGKFAIFLHKGSYKGLPQAWVGAFASLKNLGLQEAPDCKRSPFELYVNDASKTPEEELLTEIHIPVV
eukprot:TRINITY_DN2832_c0_g1_i1.p1 TRINITY_DN2832_c0_g1~~TRINITY_DN2832_c0_g1_i1.p1  ORF type:complete len:193 (-),score=62.37 TRINITY_DN2832_c0_g1_i1:38-565(-)